MNLLLRKFRIIRVYLTASSVDPSRTMRPFKHLEINTIFRLNSNDLSIDL